MNDILGYQITSDLLNIDCVKVGCLATKSIFALISAYNSYLNQSIQILLQDRLRYVCFLRQLPNRRPAASIVIAGISERKKNESCISLSHASLKNLRHYFYTHFNPSLIMSQLSIAMSFFGQTKYFFSLSSLR